MVQVGCMCHVILWSGMVQVHSYAIPASTIFNNKTIPKCAGVGFCDAPTVFLIAPKSPIDMDFIHWIMHFMA